jgi:hypothetical protein
MFVVYSIIKRNSPFFRFVNTKWDNIPPNATIIERCDTYIEAKIVWRECIESRKRHAYSSHVYSTNMYSHHAYSPAHS